MSAAGISIGILVGVISGLITLVVLKTLANASISNVKSILTLFGELTGLVAFLITANFLAKSNLFPDGVSDIRDSYLVSLTATIVLMMIYPVYRWIVKLGKELGESRG